MKKPNIINGNILQPVSKFKWLTCNVPVFKISSGVLKHEVIINQVGAVQETLVKILGKK